MASSPQLAALRSEQAALRAEIGRAARLVQRASTVGCGPEAERLARKALADARAHGLAARRAHLAARLAWLDAVHKSREAVLDGYGAGRVPPEPPPRARFDIVFAIDLTGSTVVVLEEIKARIRQEKSRLFGPIRKKVAKVEEEIEELETRKKELEARMADPELYKDEQAFSECSREYKTIERRLGRHYYNWEELQTELENKEAEFG